MKEKRIAGIGGIFFKSVDPAKLNAWYTEHLGIKTDEYGAVFEFRNAINKEQKDFIQFSPFKEDTTYFQPSEKQFMINFRVNGLEAFLEELKAAGIQQVGELIRQPYGLFAHIMDPEGNKIELWEPIPEGFKKLAGDQTNK